MSEKKEMLDVKFIVNIIDNKNCFLIMSLSEVSKNIVILSRVLLGELSSFVSTYYYKEN